MDQSLRRVRRRGPGPLFVRARWAIAAWIASCARLVTVGACWRQEERATGPPATIAKDTGARDAQPPSGLEGLRFADAATAERLRALTPP